MVALCFDKICLRLRTRRERQLYLFDTKPYELRSFSPGRPLQAPHGWTKRA